MGKDNTTKRETDRPVRLDRFLAVEGLGSRSDLKKAIRGGRALVNGSVEKDAGRLILPDDVVVFNGAQIKREQYVYYMLHKPAGLITATEDFRERTVLDLLREKGILRRGLFPVGRLDRDTEGLLLITDDGGLAHRLLSPGKHVPKTYYAIVDGPVSAEDIRRFAQGLVIDKELTAMPAELRVVTTETESTAEMPVEPSRFLNTEQIQMSAELPLPDTQPAEMPAEHTRVLVTIHEGKYHQIKRMFSAVGKKVLYLKRLSMGPLKLDPLLAPGAFRELNTEEINALRDAGRTGSPHSVGGA